MYADITATLGNPHLKKILSPNYQSLYRNIHKHWLKSKDQSKEMTPKNFFSPKYQSLLWNIHKHWLRMSKIFISHTPPNQKINPNKWPPQNSFTKVSIFLMKHPQTLIDNKKDLKITYTINQNKSSPQNSFTKVSIFIKEYPQTCIEHEKKKQSKVKFVPLMNSRFKLPTSLFLKRRKCMLRRNENWA